MVGSNKVLGGSGIRRAMFVDNCFGDYNTTPQKMGITQKKRNNPSWLMIYSDGMMTIGWSRMIPTNYMIPISSHGMRQDDHKKLMEWWLFRRDISWFIMVSTKAVLDIFWIFILQGESRSEPVRNDRGILLLRQDIDTLWRSNMAGTYFPVELED